MRKFRDSFPLSSLIIVGLISLVILPFLGSSWSWAAPPESRFERGSTTVGSDTSGKPDGGGIARTVRQLMASGYSIDGPSEVASIGPQWISLFTGRKADYVVDLQGKRISVVDENGSPLTLKDIRKMMKVYVCSKKNEVIIYVLSKKEGGNGH